MKNLKMMMLSASVAMVLFAMPSCRKEKIDPVPTEEVETQEPDDNPTDETPVDPEEPATDPDTPTDPVEEVLPAATQFSEISKAHIAKMEADLTDDYFNTSDANGVIWQEGDIYVYKTGKGSFGKFIVKSVEPVYNYRLTIAAITFNADGSVAKENNTIIVEGTWSCDLDELVQTSDFLEADFDWGRSTEVITYFSPVGDAKFKKYTLAE